MKKSSKILITGCAGFIGFHLAELLLKYDFHVIGLDQINEYYDVNLKYARLFELGISKNQIEEKILVQSEKYSNYRFIKADLEDFDFIVTFIKDQSFDFVVNLAAQAGVRYSLQNPRVYTKSNIEGFLSVLEGCRRANVKHLIYASTSSVYGLNTKMPLHEDQPSEHPVSLYAATKKANEMMAHCYSHLYGLPTTGLRFFTVYGPWGRPDMSLFLFTKAIINGEPINVFNEGQMTRDFTYVADIVESIRLLIFKAPSSDILWNGDNPRISTSKAPYRIFNIGNSSPVKLLDFVSEIESQLKISANKIFKELQPGDVISTFAETSSLCEHIEFKPSTSISYGVERFISWYKGYYKIKVFN